MENISKQEPLNYVVRFYRNTLKTFAPFSSMTKPDIVDRCEGFENSLFQHGTSGGLMVLASAISTLMMAAFLAKSVGLNWLSILFLPCYFFFNLKLESSLYAAKGIKAVSIRLFVLIVIALISGLGFKLYMFDNDLTYYFRRKLAHENSVLLENVGAIESGGERRLKSLQTQIDRHDRLSVEYKRLAVCEERGDHCFSEIDEIKYESSKNPGPGKYRRELEREARQNGHKADSLRQVLSLESVRYGVDGAKAKARQQTLTQDDAPATMLNKYVQLYDLMTEHPDANMRRGSKELYFMVSLLFLILELMPVLIKMCQNKSSYQLMVEMQEELQNAITKFEHDLQKQALNRVVAGANNTEMPLGELMKRVQILGEMRQNFQQAGSLQENAALREPIAPRPSMTKNP